MNLLLAYTHMYICIYTYITFMCVRVLNVLEHVTTFNPHAPMLQDEEGKTLAQITRMDILTLDVFPPISWVFGGRYQHFVSTGYAL